MGASTALSQPTGAPLGPPVDVAPVPNGDLSQGLTGWSTVGPAASMTLGEGPILSATDNVTVVGPSVALPADAQVVPVAIGAPGGNTVVDVRARPDDGGPEVLLATIEPTRGATTYDVPVTAVAGRSVRLVLDPTYTIGRRIIVTAMGPVRAVLPGWQLRAGAPVVATVAGRRALHIVGGPLAGITPGVDITPGARYLGFAVRGSGTVTARAGAAPVTVQASGASWTWAYAPVRRGASTAPLSFTATPATDASLDIGPVATPAVPISVGGITPTGDAVRVRATPLARGLRVEVRKGAKVVGRGVVGAAGTATVRVSASGRATVAVLGDAGRAGVTRVVRLP